MLRKPIFQKFSQTIPLSLFGSPGCREGEKRRIRRMSPSHASIHPYPHPHQCMRVLSLFMGIEFLYSCCFTINTILRKPELKHKSNKCHLKGSRQTEKTDLTSYASCLFSKMCHKSFSGRAVLMTPECGMQL